MYPFAILMLTFARVIALNDMSDQPGNAGTMMSKLCDPGMAIGDRLSLNHE
jgi:hypothetical protein